jgi:hypothetical protein
MSACDPFKLTFQGTADEFLAKAQKAISKVNGTFNGTTTGGSFDINSPIGQVAGSYTINGQELTITVTDKPMMLGCGMLEGMLKGALS